jgi:hypothetical protein
VILIIALGSVSLLIYQFVLAQDPPVSRKCEGSEIGMFRTQLALVPDADAEKRESVESKIKTWETMIAICETITPATRVPQFTPQFTQAPTASFSTGIFEGQPGAYFHAFDAKIENHWKGIIDGNRVIVFAGAWVSDPSQGFIIVQTAPSTGQAVWGYYPSETKSGALRIVDAKGSRLIIQPAKDSNLLFFDVPSLFYVNSPDEIVIQITPTETSNPIQPNITPSPYPAP